MLNREDVLEDRRVDRKITNEYSVAMAETAAWLRLELKIIKYKRQGYDEETAFIMAVEQERKREKISDDVKEEVDLMVKELNSIDEPIHIDRKVEDLELIDFNEGTPKGMRWGRRHSKRAED